MRNSHRAQFLILFLLLLAVFYIGTGILAAHGIESVLLDWLYRTGIIWLFIWWLKTDMRRRKINQLYCLGLLATVGGVIFWPYYLVRTRGAKGLLLMLAYIGFLVGGSFLGFVAYMAAGGKTW